MPDGPLDHRPTRHRRAIIASLVAVSLLCCAAPLAAQEKDDQGFTVLPEVPGVDRSRIPIKNMLKSGSISDRKLFTDYFKTQVARLTQPSSRRPGERYNPTNVRIQLKASLKSDATEQAHTDLNAFLLQEMTKLAKGAEYHPVARYNAALMIGDLDEVEPDFGGRGAVPLPAALKTLIELATAGANANATNVDGVVALGAMVGILRHARIGIPSTQDKTTVVDLALAYLDAAKPPAGRSAELHHWLRRRSAEILATLGMPGQGRNAVRVVDALTTVAAEDEAPLALRCTSAESTGYLNLTGVKNQLQGARFVDVLKALAVDVGEREKDRRMLLSYLTQLQTALLGPMVDEKRQGGLIDAVDGAEKEQLQELNNKLQEMIDLLVQSEEVPGPFAEKVEDLKDSRREGGAGAAVAGMGR